MAGAPWKNRSSCTTRAEHEKRRKKRSGIYRQAGASDINVDVGEAGLGHAVFVEGVRKPLHDVLVDVAMVVVPGCAWGAHAVRRRYLAGGAERTSVHVPAAGYALFVPMGGDWIVAAAGTASTGTAAGAAAEETFAMNGPAGRLSLFTKTQST